MKRRELLLASGALGALATARVSAQAKSPAIIGWLFVSTPAAQVIPLRNFKADLARLGHVEGRDYVVEARWTGGSPEPAPALARELVALKPAVIVTASTAGIDAVRKATATIPILGRSTRCSKMPRSRPHSRT